MEGPGSGSGGVVMVGGFVSSLSFPFGPIPLVPNKAHDDREGKGLGRTHEAFAAVATIGSFRGVESGVVISVDGNEVIPNSAGIN